MKISNVIGCTIKVAGQKLFVDKALGDGLLHILETPSGAVFRPINEDTGERMLPDERWLNEMYRRGELEIIADGHGPFPGANVQPPLSPEEILALDPRAEARVATVNGLRERDIDERHPDFAFEVAKIWIANGFVERFGAVPPASTVSAWLRKIQNEPATLTALMSRSGRVPRKRRLEPEVVSIIERLARWYYASRGRRLQDVVAEAQHETRVLNKERAALGLPSLAAPSRETLRREITRILCRETYAEKHGEKAAKSRWDGSGLSDTTKVILRLGLMDDTVIDSVVVWDGATALPLGRPYICVLMDVASRAVVGWFISFIPPTVQTAAACIRRAAFGMPVRPDRAERYPVLLEMNGKFDEIGVDNGANYVSTSFQQACADIGTTMRLMKVGAPQLKAMVERLFHTLKTFLLEKLPGFTHTPALMREFGYNPETEASITISELMVLIEDFFYAYHITVHSGIGTQPAHFWAQSLARHGRNVVANPARLAILAHSTMKRRITKAGVRAFGNMRFTHTTNVPALLDAYVARENVRNRTRSGTTATAQIKFDPENLGAIWVLNPDTNEYLKLVNVDPEYAEGLPLWRHRQILEYVKKKNLAFNTVEERMEARRLLNERVMALAPEMRARERRAMARMLGRPLAEPEVTFAKAPPTHDGLAPTIENDLAAEERIDAEVPLHRPGRSSDANRADDAVGDDAGEAGASNLDGRDEGEPDLNLEAPDPFWSTGLDEDEIWEDFA